MHTKEIDEATGELLEVMIPNFVCILIEVLDEELQASGELKNFSLTQLLHSHGINCRYLGLVAKRMGEERNYCMLLLAEMVSRVIKNDLREVFRQSCLVIPTDRPFQIILANYLNLVFSNTEDSLKFWRETVEQGLKESFGVTRDNWKQFPEDLKGSIFTFTNFEDEKKTVFDLRQYILQRLVEMMAIQFNPSMQIILDSPSKNSLFSGSKIFDWIDFKSIDVRLKLLDVVSSSKAFVFTLRGKEKESAGFFQAAKFWYERALQCFEKALISNPNDSELLRSAAMVLSKLGLLNEVIGKETLKFDQVKLSPLSPFAKKANNYFVRSLKLSPNNSGAYVSYARFLETIGESKSAELHFLHALWINPNDIEALYRYGCFLQFKDEEELSLLFFQRRHDLMSRLEND